MRTIDRLPQVSAEDGKLRQRTIDQIRAAGLQLIYERGYEGMGLRLLARKAGIGQSTLYGHFATKQDLLLDLICLHMDDLLTSLRRHVPEAGPPLPRFLAFVRFHLAYHLRRHREVFICYSELRSLNPDNHARVTKLRGIYEHVLIGIIREGIETGIMRRADARVAAYGILSLLSGVTAWFDSDGPLSEVEVCDEYIRLALAAVTDPLGAVMSMGGTALSPDDGPIRD